MAKKNGAQSENTAAEAEKLKVEIEKLKTQTADEVAKEDKKESSDLEKVLASAEDYKRKWYSVSAEYDNFRKRNAQAVSAAYRDGAADAVLKFLPVADNFGYAYESAQDEKTKAGIEKVIKSI